MALAIEKSQREQAKREKKFLVQFSIDGKCADSKFLTGGMAVTGPMDVKTGEKLTRYFIKLMKERKI